MTLRGVLFGCGAVSEFHLKGWLRIPDVEITSLGDRMLSRADARRAQFAPAARTYSDLAAMLDAERPDFVDILTAPAQHLEHCLIALERGIHVICQKPLSDTLEGARTIAAMVRGYPKVVAVHENHRYRPWFRRIVRQVNAGAYGRIAFARFEHLDAGGQPPGFRTQSETGVLLEYGSHLVDMMRAISGQPKRVYARLHRVNPNVRGESLAHAVFDYDRDASAVVSVAWKDTGLTQGRVVVCGERCGASYEGSLTRGGASRLRVTEDGTVIRDEDRSPYDDYVESFYLLQHEIAEAMLGRGEVAQTAGNYLRTLACTFAAYASAGRGQAVEIGEFASGAGVA